MKTLKILQNIPNMDCRLINDFTFHTLWHNCLVGFLIYFILYLNYFHHLVKEACLIFTVDIRYCQTALLDKLQQNKNPSKKLVIKQLWPSVPHVQGFTWSEVRHSCDQGGTFIWSRLYTYVVRSRTVNFNRNMIATQDWDTFTFSIFCNGTFGNVELPSASVYIKSPLTFKSPASQHEPRLLCSMDDI